MTVRFRYFGGADGGAEYRGVDAHAETSATIPTPAKFRDSDFSRPAPVRFLLRLIMSCPLVDSTYNRRYTQPAAGTGQAQT